MVPPGTPKTLQIEHPSGVFDVVLEFDGDAIVGAGLLRTTRCLARGEVFVPRSVWMGPAA
jgi:2-methylaconitate cis-trans-isomerase PrpF